MPSILAILLDVLMVFVFAVLGRAAHGESTEPALVWQTAAPFLLASLMAWVLLMLKRFTDSLFVQGFTVWAITLAGGMFFRVMLGESIHWSFVAVAAIMLLALFFAWRGVAHLALRRGRAARLADRRHDPRRSGNPAVRDPRGH